MKREVQTSGAPDGATDPLRHEMSEQANPNTQTDYRQRISNILADRVDCYIGSDLTFCPAWSNEMKTRLRHAIHEACLDQRDLVSDRIARALSELLATRDMIRFTLNNDGMGEPLLPSDVKVKTIQILCQVLDMDLPQRWWRSTTPGLDINGICDQLLKASDLIDITLSSNTAQRVQAYLERAYDLCLLTHVIAGDTNSSACVRWVAEQIAEDVLAWCQWIPRSGMNPFHLAYHIAEEVIPEEFQ